MILYSYNGRDIAYQDYHKEGDIVGKIIYNNLLAMMEKKGLSTYRIRKEKIISEATLQNIRKNKSITTDAIAKLCEALECQPGDILEYVPDNIDEKLDK